MKSLLKIHPNKLVFILFGLFLIVLPMILAIKGVEVNSKYYGFFVGICLVIFFFLIYPKISKNKEFLTQREEDEQMNKAIRQFSDFFKVKIAAGTMLFLILAFLTYFYFIEQLAYLEFIVPILVFGFMMYYVNFLRKHKKTKEYAEKVDKIQKESFSTFVKQGGYRGIIYLVSGIVLALFIIFLSLQK